MLLVDELSRQSRLGLVGVVHKAEGAGGIGAKVNQRGTSQECDHCGRVTPKTLADRIHNCPGCGTVEDRDVHAARVSSSIGHSRGQRGLERALERQASRVRHSLLQKPSAFTRRSIHYNLSGRRSGNRHD
jgi:ribosomal protein L37AE/L43A